MEEVDSGVHDPPSPRLGRISPRRSITPPQDRPRITARGQLRLACQPSRGEVNRARYPSRLAACGQLLVREPDGELAGGDGDDVAIAM